MSQLNALREQARAATERARAVGRDPGWSRSPAAGVWSAAECLVHLNQSSDEMLPPLERALSSAGASAEPYRMNWKERLLIWYIEPPYRLKAKARGGFVPKPASPDRILPDFEERQRRLEKLLDTAEGRALDQVRMASPVNARLSYSVWTGLVLLLAHQRRHLWQAEQTLSRLRV